jgi:hypothetical protein
MAYMAAAYTYWTFRTDKTKAMWPYLESAREAMRTASGGQVDFTAVFSLRIRELQVLSNSKATDEDKLKVYV